MISTLSARPRPVDSCTAGSPTVVPAGRSGLASDVVGSYDAGPPAATPPLAAAVARLQEAADEVLAATAGAPQPGDLHALVGTLQAIDRAQAAAVALTRSAQDQQLAERSAALPLDHALGFRTRLTGGDRRTLLRTAEVLRDLPATTMAFRTGALGWAQVRAIVSEAGPLTGLERQQLDGLLPPAERLAEVDPDRLVDEVRDRVAAIRPVQERERAVRRIERRFLAVQPQLDGALSIYGEYDPEAAATLLEAIEAACPPPSGERDLSRDAVDGDPDGVTAGTQEDATGADGGGHVDGGGDVLDPFLDAAGGQRRRSRARQRADGLLRLAESFLAGSGSADGTPRRARPRLQVVCDLRTLLGDDDDAIAGRALWAALGKSVRLTPDAVRRLASDARLQLVLTDGGEVLGITAPTSSIPRAVRDAVQARDQGCRFPGCRAPARWSDVHHVVGREAGGHTIVSNLCLLCRRHHTAVTEKRWTLTMDASGHVEVRRGRWAASSDPPIRPCLRRDPHPDRPPGAPFDTG